MHLSVAARRQAIEAALQRALNADVRIAGLALLRGGAIQENWRLDVNVDGVAAEWVLRTNAPSQVPFSLTRSQEFAVLRVAYRAGVTVPEPILLIDDEAAIGRPFYLMRRRQGVARGPEVVRDRSIGGDREALVERLGRELAIVHSILPPLDALGFLAVPSPSPATDLIARLRRFLDGMDTPHPGLEWGLRWCDLHQPPVSRITLTHQDFRTGNLLLGEDGLAAILDWEFAEWGDPAADLGWLCARCWRYSRPDLEAGGLGSRAALYRGYAQASGTRIDADAVRFWEVMAHLRWAVIALQQGDRHLSGRQLSLELALTGRILPELEWTLLQMTRPDAWRAA